MPSGLAKTMKTTLVIKVIIHPISIDQLQNNTDHSEEDQGLSPAASVCVCVCVCARERERERERETERERIVMTMKLSIRRVF